MKPPRWKRPDNATAYALCKRLANGHLKIRCIVWGRLMANAERRDEEITCLADIHVLETFPVKR